MGGIMGAIVGQQETERGLTAADQAQSQANQLMQNLANASDASRPLLIQQYRQAGILTPEMESAISAGPSAMSQVSTNGKGIQAQEQALKQMQDRAATGMTATDRAALAKAQSQSNVSQKAKLDQIMQQYKMMGQGGGTAALAAQLQAAQGGANEESQNALDIMGRSQQQALQAAAQAGGLGSQLEGQQFGEQSQKAQAADQMNRFNVQNQMAAQQQNVGAKNQAQASNLANLQNIGNQNVNMGNQEQARQRAGEQQNFQNQVGLASTKAGQLQNYGNFQANAGAARGKAAADTGSAMDKGMMSAIGMFSQGGQVPSDYTNGGHVGGHEVMPGDHPENDTVDAKLSPGEIVIPKSIAETSLGDKLLNLLQHHHEIKTHLDSIEKKASKSKQKMAGGGMAMPPQMPPNLPLNPAMQQRFSDGGETLSNYDIFAKSLKDKLNPQPPVQKHEETMEEKNERIRQQAHQDFMNPHAGYAGGGEVMDPVDRQEGLNMFAPGALENKPSLAQYDDRRVNAMNTDTPIAPPDSSDSGGLSDMLAKFKALGGASKDDKKKSDSGDSKPQSQGPSPFTETNSQQAGLSMIANNKPQMPQQMQAPQANFSMPRMSDGGQVPDSDSDKSSSEWDKAGKSIAQGIDPEKAKQFHPFNQGGIVPEKGTTAYLEHLMSQLHGKKNYADGTVDEQGGVVPQPQDYPAPEIDPALAQQPSQQLDMPLPQSPKPQMELPEEEMPQEKSSKSKQESADKELEASFEKEVKKQESQDKPASEDDQMEKDLKPDEEASDEEKSEPEDNAKEESTESKEPSDSDKSEYTNAELKELQKKRKMMLGLSGLAQSGAMLGGALNRFDPSKNVKAFQDAEKQYDLPIQDFKDLIANQQNDPSSSTSKAARATYEKIMGTPANPNWSATDLAKQSPLLEKYLQAQQATAAKKDKQKDDLQFKYDKLQQDRDIKLQGITDKKERDKIANDFKQQMLDVRKDMVALSAGRLGATVTGKIEGEDTIKKANQRIHSADQAITQLADKSQPLTMNRLNAIQIDLANTLNFMASQGASDYKAKSDKLENLNTMIASAKQKYGTSLIDLRTQAPEVYNEVMAYAKSVKESTTKIRDQRYKEYWKRFRS